MTGEAYCSYEILELLKEKGFDGNYAGRYMPHYDDDGTGELYYPPTHQLVCAWLREKFHLHIVGNIFQDFSNDADGNVVDEWIYWSWNVYSTLSGKKIAEAPFGNDAFDSYEEAIENGIKCTLENWI